MVHKVNSAGATAENEFTEGNPATAVPATVVPASWMNMVQRELVACVEAAGLAPDEVDDTQLLQALRTLGLVRSMKNGDTVFSLPSAGGEALLKHLTAAAQLALESGAADVLAKLVLREPGVGRGWSVEAGSSDKQLKFGYKPSTAGAVDPQMYMDEAGNLFSINNASKGTTGYVRLLNGMILQWGRITTTINPGDAATVVTLPLAFPTICLFAMACPRNNTPNANQGCWAEVRTFTQTQLTLYAQYSGAGANTMEGLYWMALGE